MTPSAMRIALRSALSECRQFRGDSQAHLKACYEEVMAMPQGEWQWYIAYFQGEADRSRGVLGTYGRRQETDRNDAHADATTALATDTQLVRDAARQEGI